MGFLLSEHDDELKNIIDKLSDVGEIPKPNFKQANKKKNLLMLMLMLMLMILATN